jgi:hypothetical protein
VPQLVDVTINLRGFGGRNYAKYDGYLLISYWIYYLLISTQFLLSIFADASPRQSINKNESTSFESHPVLSAGIINHLFFLWFNKLIWNGFRKPLEIDDITELCPEDKSSETYPVFEREWMKGI